MANPLTSFLGVSKSPTENRHSSKTVSNKDSTSAVGGVNLKESCGNVTTVITQLSSSSKFHRKLLVLSLEKKIKSGNIPGILKMLAVNSESIFSASAAEIEQLKLRVLKKTPLKGLMDTIKSVGGTLLYSLKDQEIHFKDDD